MLRLQETQSLRRQEGQVHNASGLLQKKEKSVSFRLEHWRWYQKEHLSQQILLRLFTAKVLLQCLQYLSTHFSHLHGLYEFFCVVL